MNNKLLVAGGFSLLLLTASCHFYKEYDKKAFSTYSWSDGQEVVFVPKIDDNTKTYQLKLGLRHHYGLQTKSFGVKIKIVSPSGNESSKDYDLKIKDDNNNPIANCAGDLCDLETIIFNELKFEEVGDYRISISHNEKGYRIPGILEVGLIIDVKN
jgi:gliding motility-associated lipoprotein GldH